MNSAKKSPTQRADDARRVERTSSQSGQVVGLLRH